MYTIFVKYDMIPIEKNRRGLPVDEKLKRAIFYILTRLTAVIVVVGIVIGFFFSSMKTSNVYFLLNDALKARLDIILLGSDIEDNSRFFSYNYMQSQEYEPLKENYSLYIISNYGHKLSYSNLFVWPWQRTKTVTVREAVFAINGELDTTKISKADAMAHDVYNIPAWNDSVYKVKLIYENGAWLIDSITRKGDYNYEPVKTHDLTDEQIEALKTPQPTPTMEPVPTEIGATEPPLNRSAIISTPIAGTTVNLREGPATAYKILAELRSGDRVTVTDETDGWYYVTLEDGTKGYISGYYILFE